MVPQEKMVSSVSLTSDASAIYMTGNTIGKSALASSDESDLIHHPFIFADEIIGPVVTNNQLSGNARITMSGNKFGRLCVIVSH